MVSSLAGLRRAPTQQVRRPWSGFVAENRLVFLGRHGMSGARLCSRRLGFKDPEGGDF